MFLCKMDKESEKIRILDDLDTTLSLENTNQGGGKLTSIEVNIQTIVFRISYRDIMLAKSIVDRAIELSSAVGETDQSKMLPII